MDIIRTIVAWSVVCDCGISSSHSLVFWIIVLHTGLIWATVLNGGMLLQGAFGKFYITQHNIEVIIFI